MKLNVGLIGCGHLGQYHAKLYSGMNSVRFIGVHDSNVASGQKLAFKHNCKFYADLELMFKEVDAVSIATPATTHRQIAELAIENGCHILVEKPVAHEAKEASKLAGLAKKKKLCFCVGHVERFNPAFRSMLHENPLPRFIEVHRLSAFGQRGTDVDVILDIMIHDIDLVLHAINSPLRSIDASGVAVASKSLDIANARILFKNGCTANITASRISNKKMRKFRVFQPGKYFSLDLAEPCIEIYQLPPSQKQLSNSIELEEGNMRINYRRPELPETNPLEEELTAFIDSIIQKKIVRNIATAEEGIKALEVAEIIRKSCMKKHAW